jgi:hypothetical protein
MWESKSQSQLELAKTIHALDRAATVIGYNTELLIQNFKSNIVQIYAKLIKKMSVDQHAKFMIPRHKSSIFTNFNAIKIKIYIVTNHI